MGRFRFTLRDLLLATALLSVMLALSVPAMRSAQRSSSEALCTGNLASIAIALANYHEVYGTFPPAYVVGQDGKPMHSWRALLLPYLGYQKLYDRYDFQEPWNGPHNRNLAKDIPDEYRCPLTRNRAEDATNYVAIVGSGTAWPGSKSLGGRDATKAFSRTIVLIEIGESDICWMEPRDVNVADVIAALGHEENRRIYARAHGGVRCMLGGGHVHTFTGECVPEVVRGLVTVDDAK